MGVLPWADWFYDVGDKRDEVNALHAQALSIADDIQDRTLQLNSILQQYRALLSVNQSLLVSHAVTVMPDQDLATFKAGVQDLPPMPKGLLLVNVLQVFSESAVFGLAATLLWNGTTEAKALFTKMFDAISTRVGGRAAPVALELDDWGSFTSFKSSVYGPVSSDGLGSVVGPSVSEDGAKAVFGKMTSAELAEAGLGIFAAVGIDAVFGAIEGAHESAQLEQSIADLQACVDKARAFLDQINTNINGIKTAVVQQEDLFVQLVAALESIKPAAFTYDLPRGFENLLQFLAAQQQAFTEYGTLADLRLYYQRAQAREVNPTRQEIIDHYMITAPPGMTTAIVGQYWDILARYSDAMNHTN